jgi:hypothetical protein
MPWPIYQNMVNLIVGYSIRSRQIKFMNVTTSEHCTFNFDIFRCDKIYYSNSIIIMNFVQTFIPKLNVKYLLLLLLLLLMLSLIPTRRSIITSTFRVVTLCWLRCPGVRKLINRLSTSNLRLENVNKQTTNKQTPWLLASERTIPNERPPPVGEVSANYCG